MNPVIQKLHEAQLRKDLPEFRPGDTVRVNVRLQEGEGAPPGIRRRGDLQERPGVRGYLYGAPGQLWRWHRTHFPAALPNNQLDRSRWQRYSAPCAAILPARFE